MKTWRYSGFGEDGIYTRRGDPIVDDVTPWGLTMQFIGFPPAEYTRKQEENQLAKGIDKEVNLRRSNLLRKLYIELRHGNTIDDVYDEILEFNKRHPQFGIDANSIRRSLKQHMRQSKLMHNGVSLSPAMRRVVLESDYYVGDDWNWWN